jgi:hypothetical protein
MLTLSCAEKHHPMGPAFHWDRSVLIVGQNRYPTNLDGLSQKKPNSSEIIWKSAWLGAINTGNNQSERQISPSLQDL